MPGIDDSKQFVPLKIAVLTVSDSRNLKDDKSGALLVQRIGTAGHLVAERSIIPDDIEAIRARVKAWIADPVVDVIITTGGTGFTGRDVTPEAVEPLFEKKMDAFSALFLVVSFQKIGTSAIQSRATAGLANGTYIFCLPGSPNACRDAWDEILVHQLDYRYGPCNFVPGIAAGAWGARQAKNVSAVGKPGGGARLNRRSADLRQTHDQKQRRERLHLLFEQRLDRFRRDVAAGEPGSAGGNDDIDHRIGDPGLDARADRLDVVGHDAALGDDMSGRYDALH